MDECKKEWINQQVHLMNKWMNKWMNEERNKWIDKWINEWKKIWMDQEFTLLLSTVLQRMKRRRRGEGVVF